MLTWICIGIAFQVAWFIVQFTQLKWLTVHEFFEIIKEYKWALPLSLALIAFNILTWPITVASQLWDIYKFYKEKEEGL